MLRVPNPSELNCGREKKRRPKKEAAFSRSDCESGLLFAGEKAEFKNGVVCCGWRAAACYDYHSADCFFGSGSGEVSIKCASKAVQIIECCVVDGHAHNCNPARKDCVVNVAAGTSVRVGQVDGDHTVEGSQIPHIIGCQIRPPGDSLISGEVDIKGHHATDQKAVIDCCAALFQILACGNSGIYRRAGASIGSGSGRLQAKVKHPRYPRYGIKLGSPTTATRTPTQEVVWIFYPPSQSGILGFKKIRLNDTGSVLAGRPIQVGHRIARSLDGDRYTSRFQPVLTREPSTRVWSLDTTAATVVLVPSVSNSHTSWTAAEIAVVTVVGVVVVTVVVTAVVVEGVVVEPPLGVLDPAEGLVPLAKVENCKPLNKAPAWIMPVQPVKVQTPPEQPKLPLPENPPIWEHPVPPADASTTKEAAVNS